MFLLSLAGADRAYFGQKEHEIKGQPFPYTRLDPATGKLTDAVGPTWDEAENVLGSEGHRAIAERKTKGFIKVMVVRGRPVGVSIVGHQAGELISLWALALANGMKMSQIASMVAPYPTIGEVNKRAAGAYFSPRLFDNPWVKQVVGLVQRYLP